MEYMLWYLIDYKDLQKKLNEALNYYRDKYREPHSIIVPTDIQPINTTLIIIESETIPCKHIGISSQQLKSE